MTRSNPARPRAPTAARTAAVAIAALLSAPAALPAAASLNDAVPASALAVFEISDISALLKHSKEHPALSILRDEEVLEFFAPLVESMTEEGFGADMAEELGLDEGEAEKLFPGRALVAITGVTLDWDDLDNSDPEPQMAFLLDYAGTRERMEEMIQSSADYDAEAEGNKHRIIEEDHAGVKLYLEEVESDDGEVEEVGGYALVEGTFVTAHPIDTLKDVVARLQGDEDSPSLVSTNAYQKMRDRAGKSDLLVYLNMEPIVALGKRALEVATRDEPPNPLINPVAAFEALGLEAIENLYLSASFSEAGADLQIGLGASEIKGVLSLLAYRQGEVRFPTWIPAGAVGASYSLFSIADLYARLEKLIANVSPMAGGLLMGQLAALKANSGVDLRTALIENFGHEVIMYSHLGGGQEEGSEAGIEDLNELYAISVLDRQGMQLAIDGIIRGLTGGAELFDERDYLGTKIRSLKSQFVGDGDDAINIAYAFVGDYVMIAAGKARILEETIARFDKAGGESLWDDEDLRDGLSQLPGGESEIAYQDLGALAHSVFVTLAGLQRQFRGDMEICNPDALPGPKKFPFFVVGKTYARDDGLFQHATLLKKSE